MADPIDVTGWNDGHMVFLEMAGMGAIDGQIYEWPQLKPACRWAAQEIKRLTGEAAERDGAVEHCRKLMDRWTEEHENGGCAYRRARDAADARERELQARLDEVRRIVERFADKGRTHWEGCHEEHALCAIALALGPKDTA